MKKILLVLCCIATLSRSMPQLAPDDANTSTTEDDYGLFPNETIVYEEEVVPTVPKIKPMLRPACSLNSCRKSAEYLRGPMNDSANPCNDFKEFSCGNWDKKFKIPPFASSWGYLEQQQYNLKLQAFAALSGEGSDFMSHSSESLLAARRAFDACVLEQTSFERGYQFWKEDVEEKLLGFPLAEEFWRRQNFDLTEMLSNAVHVLGGFSFLNVEIEERSQGPNAILIELGETLLPPEIMVSGEDNELKMKFKDMLVYTAIELRKQEKLYEENILKKGHGRFEPAKGSDAPTVRVFLESTETFSEAGNLTSVPELPPAKRLVNVLETDLPAVPEEEKASEPTSSSSSERRLRREILNPPAQHESAAPESITLTLVEKQVSSLLSLTETVARILLEEDEDEVQEVPFSQLEAMTDVEADLPELPEALKKRRERNQINFNRYLSGVFTPLMPDFDPKDYLYLVRPRQLSRLQAVLAAADSESVANWVGWLAFEKALPHMPWQFRRNAKEFRKAAYGIEREEKLKYRCTGYLLDEMPLLFGQMLYNTLGSRRAERKLNNMRNHLNGQFEALPHSTSDAWLFQDPGFPSGANHILYDRHLPNFLHFSSAAAASKLLKLSKTVDSEDTLPAEELQRLLSVKDLGDTTSVDLLPGVLKTFPLLDEGQGMDFQNFAGAGWILLKRRLALLGQDVDADAVTVLLDLYEDFEHNQDDVTLPGLQEFSPRQTALLWLARVWGCGGSYAHASFTSEAQEERAMLWEALEGAAEQEFQCN